MTGERKPLVTWHEIAERRNIELEILRNQNATLRAALAERQVAIDELVACMDLKDATLRADDTIHPEDFSELLRQYKERKPLAWIAIRALATKEPQS